jgi:hypothetical protein
MPIMCAAKPRSNVTRSPFRRSDVPMAGFLDSKTAASR